MAKRKTNSDDPFASSPAAVALLKQSAWTFGARDDQVYELQVQLATPGVFTPVKADILIPGLPTLDGFLSFVAFRAALSEAFTAKPEMATELLWQWNAALRDPTLWIDFSLPLGTVSLGAIEVFDCSIGLPMDGNDVLVPAGAFFAKGLDLETYPYPKVTDSIPLRRRVAEPYHRPLSLKHQLETGSGPTKLLDNRMYFALTKEYRFYFRGDVRGVERLLTFAHEHRIGMGKKTTLGYGQIAKFEVRPSTATATLVHLLPKRTEYSLIKTLPYEAVMSQRTQNNPLFGNTGFRVINPIETLGAYRPPFWRRERQTQVLNYGTMLLLK
jgi:hypothetical protein